MSRILIWSPNYAPELVGIPPLVTSAARWLAARGHEVDVVTALPNYPDRRIFPGWSGALARSDLDDLVRVHRSWLRVRPHETFADKALYEATFASTSAPRAFRLMRGADALLCIVPTLITASLGVAAASAVGCRCTLWVQDLVLSAAHSLDDIGGLERRVLSAVRRLERFALCRTDRIVSCSPGFVPYLTGLGADPARIEVIPNWVDTSEIARVPEPAANGFVDFLYTGNLGYTQAFGTLFEAARLAGPGLRIVVAGGGNAHDEVTRLAQPPHVVRPTVPRSEYPRLLGSAHVLVIAQRSVAANANLPSKLASYLASGRPIAASIGLDTPAAELLRESGAAIVVPPEDPGPLADAIAKLRDDSELRTRLGRAARSFAVERLDIESVLPRLAAVVLGETSSDGDE